jgi:hypothetical protein
MPCPYQIRTLFNRKSFFIPLLHRLIPVPDPGNRRCRDCATAEQGQESLKQGTNKVKTRYESHPNNLTFLLFILNQNRACKLAKSVPLVYGLFTGSVPIRHQECTGKLLRRYQRATKSYSGTVAWLKVKRGV